MTTFGENARQNERAKQKQEWDGVRLRPKRRLRKEVQVRRADKNGDTGRKDGSQ
jgi:hypothetical protein